LFFLIIIQVKLKKVYMTSIYNMFFYDKINYQILHFNIESINIHVYIYIYTKEKKLTFSSSKH